MEEQRGFGWFGCLALIIIGALAFGLLHRLVLAPLGSFLSDSLSGLRGGLSGLSVSIGPMIGEGLASIMVEFLMVMVFLLPVALLVGIVYVIFSVFWQSIRSFLEFILELWSEF